MAASAFLWMHMEKLVIFFCLRRATCRRRLRRRRLHRPSMEQSGVVDVAALLVLPRIRSIPMIKNIPRLTTLHRSASLHATFLSVFIPLSGSN